MLREARLAFGPVYFCAASSGSATLCESAAAELRAITIVDLLDPTPQRLGDVDGLTGELRSASYDFGLTWAPAESAYSVGPGNSIGHSAALEGEARRGDDVVPFTAVLELPPQYQGQRAVPTTPAAGVVDAGIARLEVRFDAGAWASRINFDRQPAGARLAIAPGSSEHNAVVLGMTSIDPPLFTWIRGE